jgi:membrane protease YdiL (CAAX protease family)
MTLLSRWHPGRLLHTLQAIDNTFPSYRFHRAQALRRVWVTLAIVCLCLWLLNYAKLPEVWHAVLALASRVSGLPGHGYRVALHEAGWLVLSEYFWWGACHVLAFFVLPWLCIRYVYRERLMDYGLRWNAVWQHRHGYGALLALIVVFVLLVSWDAGFVAHYPFYRLSGRSWLDWGLWELIYIGQFVCLEFFFRGFMLHALRPALGANAILVMCVPYMMIHLPKLPLEAFGAIGFGLLLGMLAMLSRSIWGGVLVHVGVALSMDVASLWRQQALPKAFWPF